MLTLEEIITLNEIAKKVRQANNRWWIDLQTDQPLNRNVGELLMLCVSELAEAMEGHRKNLADDKLPHHKMFDVEIADTFIRLFDIAGGLIPLGIGAIIDEKMRFSTTRADHSREHRLAPNGKKY